VLLGSKQQDSVESSKIVLAGFTLSRKWFDKVHVPLAENQRFESNILFASHNAFNFKTLSRRDDLISLAYLTVYLVSGELNWFRGMKSKDPKLFEKVKKIKNQMTPQSLCVGLA
jgi:hypothetical protein